jgi:hypothetical protein
MMDEGRGEMKDCFTALAMTKNVAAATHSATLHSAQAHGRGQGRLFGKFRMTILYSGEFSVLESLYKAETDSFR